MILPEIGIQLLDRDGKSIPRRFSRGGFKSILFNAWAGLMLINAFKLTVALDGKFH